MLPRFRSVAPALATLVAIAISTTVAAGAADHVTLSPKDVVTGIPAERGGTACAGGEIHDDGAAENGYGWNAATIADGRLADDFAPTSYPFTYTAVCVCWARLGADDSLAFDLQVYDDDGPAGAPGTLLGSLPAVAHGVGLGLPGTFYELDVSSLGLRIANGKVYIGPRWNATVEQRFFVCADQSVTTPLGNGHGSRNGAPWETLPSLFPAYRRLLVRAIGAPLSVVEVPALGEAGLATLLAALAVGGVVTLRRHRRPGG